MISNTTLRAVAAFPWLEVIGAVLVFIGSIPMVATFWPVMTGHGFEVSANQMRAAGGFFALTFGLGATMLTRKTWAVMLTVLGAAMLWPL
jgi:hypothetical protein